MSSRVAITAAGALSPLGDDLETFSEALFGGARGFHEIDRFDQNGVDVHRAAGIDFDPRSYLEGNVRPIDRTGQLSIIASKLALEAAGLDAAVREERPVGLVLGTMFGSIKTIAGFDRRAQEAGPKYAKPFEFANSVINAAAGQTAIWHGLKGLNSTVAGGAAAGVQALAYAADMIRTSRASVLLAGGAEELSYESLFGFARAGRLAPDDVAGGDVPFDVRRLGFRLGEGAALLVLEAPEAASSRGATIVAEIRGHASGFDPSRGRNDAAAQATIARVVGLALADAEISAASIDVVSLSANGSPAGDVQEAAGVAAALGGKAADVAVMAVKSQLGESLGASGAFQTLALVEAMCRGKVPGIVGLEHVNDAFPLPGVSAESRDAEVRRGLVVGRSFDGNVGVLVVEAG